VIDPDLDADDTIGGVRFGQAIVDIGAQCLQRHAALRLLLDTRNLSAAEPATHHHLDAFGANTHRFLHGLFHRPAE
jgi:glycerol dehydrogenase-like iron-containing ADH family enzyme